jgi:hypothetical protein
LERPLLLGGELVDMGLADLAEESETVESLLVSIGAPRLRALGFKVTSPFPDAEERLYIPRMSSTRRASLCDAGLPAARP